MDSYIYLLPFLKLWKVMSIYTSRIVRLNSCSDKLSFNDKWNVIKDPKQCLNTHLQASNVNGIPLTSNTISDLFDVTSYNIFGEMLVKCNYNCSILFIIQYQKITIHQFFYIGRSVRIWYFSSNSKTDGQVHARGKKMDDGGMMNSVNAVAWQRIFLRSSFRMDSYHQSRNVPMVLSFAWW